MSNFDSLLSSLPFTQTLNNHTLPSPVSLKQAASSLPLHLPQTGSGQIATLDHLIHDLAPAFNGPRTSSHYYGFVTGGTLPIAAAADNIVTAFDQNVQVHLPDQSITTVLEARTLDLLIELLHLQAEDDTDRWSGKTFTTGATAANILGLAAAREKIINQRLSHLGQTGTVGDLGLLQACARAQVSGIQVLVSHAHSSIYKAASLLGLGRDNVIDLTTRSMRLEIETLAQALRNSPTGVLNIVVLSAGEVNSGQFSIDGCDQMKQVRALCDAYDAWIHVDGGMHLSSQYQLIHSTHYILDISGS